MLLDINLMCTSTGSFHQSVPTVLFLTAVLFSLRGTHFDWIDLTLFQNKRPSGKWRTFGLRWSRVLCSSELTTGCHVKILKSKTRPKEESRPVSASLFSWATKRQVQIFFLHDFFTKLNVHSMIVSHMKNNEQCRLGQYDWTQRCYITENFFSLNNIHHKEANVFKIDINKSAHNHDMFEHPKVHSDTVSQIRLLMKTVPRGRSSRGAAKWTSRWQCLVNWCFRGEDKVKLMFDAMKRVPLFCT